MLYVYKYIPPERVLACIPEVGDGTLRVTQPAALNDPFELAVIPVYALSEDDGTDQEFAEALTDLNDNVPVTLEQVVQARQDFGSLYARQLLDE